MIRYFRYTFIYTTFFLLPIYANAQQENNSWVQNNNVISFMADTFSVQHSENIARASSARNSISDKNGDLLFFSDGITLWDKDFNKLPNGESISGNRGGAQFLQHPTDTNLVFLISQGDNYRNTIEMNLYFSIIDRRLNGGNGDIILVQKNILFWEDVSVGFAFAKGVCGDIWIVTQEQQSNRFLAFEFSEEGISEPVTSDVTNLNRNRIKISPNAQYIIGYSNLNQPAILYSFDNKTGVVEEIGFLPLDESGNYLSSDAAFSPNSSKLYTLERERQNDYKLYQYDLSLSDFNAIVASKILIHRFPVNRRIGIGRTPIGKIFVDQSNDTLAAILAPNLAGIASNFVEDYVTFDRPTDLNSRLKYLTVFPDEPSLMDSSLLPIDIHLCSETSISIKPQAEGDNYLWQDGSTSQNYEIIDTGIYWINVYRGNCIFTDTIKVFPNKLAIQLPKDTLLCEKDSLILKTDLADSLIYNWQDGSSKKEFVVKTAGLYHLTVRDSFCQSSDSIEVDFAELSIQLPTDTTLCDVDSLLLQATYMGNAIRWQDGTTQTELVINQSGKYIAEVTTKHCSKKDSIVVTFQKETTAFLPNDTVLCNEENFLINLQHINFDSIRWQDGNHTANFLIENDGIYSATIKQNTCSRTDSIAVTFKTIQSNLLKDTSICEGEILDIDLAIPDANYLWQDNSTLPSFSTSSAGTYWVAIGREECEIRDSFHLTIKPQPTINLGNDTVLCEGETLRLMPAEINGDYDWQDGSSEPFLEVTAPNVYWLTIRSESCIVSDTINIDYKSCEKTDLCQVYLPNVFSPNQDGINDEFKALSNCDLSRFKLEIYDRWGTQLFATNDITQGWQGNSQNQSLSNGVYMVQLQYQLANQDKLNTIAKTVSLIR